MVVRDISQAATELSALIEEVLKGEEVILARAGKPVARLIAYQHPAQSLPQEVEDAFGVWESEA